MDSAGRAKGSAFASAASDSKAESTSSIGALTIPPNGIRAIRRTRNTALPTPPQMLVLFIFVVFNFMSSTSYTLYVLSLRTCFTYNS